MSNLTGGRLTLRFPNELDRDVFEVASREFRNCDTPFAFGYEKTANFDAYIELLANYRRGVNLPAGHVPALFLLAEVDGTVVGRITLRLRLNEPLRRFGGHVSYAVRPDFRGQGLAKEMLIAVTRIARLLGLKKLLICSSIRNLASRHVIVACGGIFDGQVIYDDGEVRDRYWISTTTDEADSIEPLLPDFELTAQGTHSSYF